MFKKKNRILVLSIIGLINSVALFLIVTFIEVVPAKNTVGKTTYRSLELR